MHARVILLSHHPLCLEDKLDKNNKSFVSPPCLQSCILYENKTYATLSSFIYRLSQFVVSNCPGKFFADEVMSLLLIVVIMRLWVTYLIIWKLSTKNHKEKC